MWPARGRSPRPRHPALEDLEQRALLSSGQPATETKPYVPPGLITPARLEAVASNPAIAPHAIGADGIYLVRHDKLAAALQIGVRPALVHSQNHPALSVSAVDQAIVLLDSEARLGEFAHAHASSQ